MRPIFFASVLLLTVLSSCEKKEVTTAQDNVVQEITLNGTNQSFTPAEKELIVLNRDRQEYSKVQLDKIKNVANFYTSSSKNNMVIYHRENLSSQLGYSFERSEWEGRNYIQIGIFTKSGSNLSTLQWLFFDPDSNELFEFDLHTKKLQKFP